MSVLMTGPAGFISCRLAAKVEVRQSIEAPHTYLATNLAGSFQLLQAARTHLPAHPVTASSRSVYGGSPTMPYRAIDPTDQPMSLYAATRKETEGTAHSHAAPHGLTFTMLRFFTGHGSWGRTDMAPFLVTEALMQDRPIPLLDHGRRATACRRSRHGHDPSRHRPAGPPDRAAHDHPTRSWISAIRDVVHPLSWGRHHRARAGLPPCRLMKALPAGATP